jgi:hypothetical protein
VAPRSNNKLSFKFFGPFQITDKIGQVAYRLDLPSASAIHPVFHVSQLKKAIARGAEVIPTLPLADLEFQIPSQVLQRRIVTRDGVTVPQVLVRWSGFPSELATWEDFEALHQRFPRAPAWGQACLQEGGMSGVRLPVLKTSTSTTLQLAGIKMKFPLLFLSRVGPEETPGPTFESLARCGRINLRPAWLAPCKQINTLREGGRTQLV